MRPPRHDMNEDVVTEPSQFVYAVPDDLAWIDGTDVDADGELYLTKVPDGRTVLLTGSARLIWLVAAEGQAVLPAVADLAGAEPSAIRGDVDRFLGDLLSRGLLVRARTFET